MNCAADSGQTSQKWKNSGRCLLTFEAVRRLKPELAEIRLTTSLVGKTVSERVEGSDLKCTLEPSREMVQVCISP